MEALRQEACRELAIKDEEYVRLESRRSFDRARAETVPMLQEQMEARDERLEAHAHMLASVVKRAEKSERELTSAKEKLVAACAEVRVLTARCEAAAGTVKEALAAKQTLRIKLSAAEKEV